MTAKHVTSWMQGVSPHYGWPDTLASDSGPYYNSTELKQTVKNMGAHQITNSSQYHQSNVLAEKKNMYSL